MSDDARSLMWFRNDLRTIDNTALLKARRAGEVVGVFLVAEQQWRTHDWGQPKIDFVMRNVAALSAALAKLHIPLRIIAAPSFADAPDAIVDVMRQHDCTALYVNREYEVNERRRDEAVAAAVKKAGAMMYGDHDQTILPPDDHALRTGEGRCYSVFTPFSKAWLNRVEDGDKIRTHGEPPKQAPLDIKSDPVDAGDSFADLWPGGQDAALDRIQRFTADGGPIDSYHDQRDLPAIDGTSMISPYLACGSISPRQCWAAATHLSGGRIDRRRHGRAKWLMEVIWREFYRHIMLGFPRVSMSQPFRRDMDSVGWRDDEAAFDAWRDGRTGVPIVDAAMRQLREIGWMHNRLRMIVAMFLTKNLMIDWRWGERHFMHHLVDGDLASNNGGWQWSASTGNDAAPYFRIFNPTSQSQKCDPDGAFIRRYVSELADVDAPEIHDPAPLTRASCNYPEPIVDLKASRAAAIEAFKKAKG